MFVDISGLRRLPYIHRRSSAQYQDVSRDFRSLVAVISHYQLITRYNLPHFHCVQAPFCENLLYPGKLIRLANHQHPLLRFGEHDLIGSHSFLSHRHAIYIHPHPRLPLGRHLRRRAGDPRRPHILNSDNQFLPDDLQRRFQKQLLHEGIADLH
jgi:hypothetical protein